MNLFIDFSNEKTILQYMTDIYQEDIPKHILQENKIRLNSFFPGTGIRTEERDSVYIQICILLR